MRRAREAEEEDSMTTLDPSQEEVSDVKRSRGEPADSNQAKKGKHRERKRKQRKQQSSNLWLPDLGLTMVDKKDLQGHGMLRGRIIMAAVQLLRQQFQGAGLPYIRAVSVNVPPTTQPTVQFHIDCQQSHAFVTACDGKRVVVADSFNAEDFGDVALQQIEDSYKDFVEDPVKNMEYLLVDQQSKLDKDCVLHAIANVYELLAPDGSTECVYDRQLMRPHLKQCFKNRKITEFPKEYKLGPTEKPLEPRFNWQH